MRPSNSLANSQENSFRSKIEKIHIDKSFYQTDAFYSFVENIYGKIMISYIHHKLEKRKHIDDGEIDMLFDAFNEVILLDRIYDSDYTFPEIKNLIKEMFPDYETQFSNIKDYEFYEILGVFCDNIANHLMKLFPDRLLKPSEQRIIEESQDGVLRILGLDNKGFAGQFELDLGKPNGGIN